MGTEKLIIFGTDYMSRKLAALAEQIGRLPSSIAFLSDQTGGEEEIDGIRVIQGSLDSAKQIADNTSGRKPLFICGMGGTDNYTKRPQIIAATGLPDDAFATLIDPDARMGRLVDLSPGVAVFPYAVLYGNRIGKHSLIMPHVVMGVGASVGDFGIVGANATIGDGAQVGNCVYLDAGSVIKQDSVIGNGAHFKEADGRVIFPSERAVRDSIRQL